MYKALGVILLAVGCVYFIYMMIYERKEKLYNLKEMKKAIICFKNELEFSMPEIAILCEKTSERTEGEISRILADVAKSFHRDRNLDFHTAWEKAKKNELFNGETKEILDGFFCDFGKKSLELELSNLERVLRSLEERENAEEKKYTEERKLICTLGAAFCATVIIIAI